MHITQEQLEDHILALHLMDDLDRHGDGITDWEAEYMRDLRKWIKDNKPLTEGQLMKLRDIHADRR